MTATRLYCLDLDGTVISSYMDAPGQNFHEWSVLEGRQAALQELRAQGCGIAFVTNQAGVAYGFQNESETIQKFIDVLSALGLMERYTFYGVPDECLVLGQEGTQVLCLSRANRHMKKYYERLRNGISIHVCYGHKNGTVEPYNRYEYYEHRKPAPAMIYTAMDLHGATRSSTRFVGDMESDRHAAEAAGVAYQHPDDFFAPYWY